MEEMKKKGNVIALLPIGVFLVLYLGLGILFEYVMEIPMGFYNVPIVVAFLSAILVACVQNRTISFDRKLELMAKGVGDKNIITMLLIFLTAGSFVGVVGRSSAESVAYCMLSLIPARFSVAVLFVVACFVSVAMGTSVGTITLLTPIAVAVSKASGFDMAFCVASVMGGAMFGDNLSFISDTTIAACNGQGCQMKDKFRENFWIAFPAAVVTLTLILILSFQTEKSGTGLSSYTDPSICSGADRRYHRHQCICGTSDRNYLRRIYHASWRTYRTGGASDQYRLRCFRNVRDLYGGYPCSSHVCADPGAWRL